ncbi:MAG: hypothetical protein ABIO70_30380 [Pseudomonadota bacterium]
MEIRDQLDEWIQASRNVIASLKEQLASEEGRLDAYLKMRSAVLAKPEEAESAAARQRTRAPLDQPNEHNIRREAELLPAIAESDVAADGVLSSNDLCTLLQTKTGESFSKDTWRRVLSYSVYMGRLEKVSKGLYRLSTSAREEVRAQRAANRAASQQ